MHYMKCHCFFPFICCVVGALHGTIAWIWNHDVAAAAKLYDFLLENTALFTQFTTAMRDSSLQIANGSMSVHLKFQTICRRPKLFALPKLPNDFNRRTNKKQCKNKKTNGFQLIAANCRIQMSLHIFVCDVHKINCFVFHVTSFCFFFV